MHLQKEPLHLAHELENLQENFQVELAIFHLEEEAAALNLPDLRFCSLTLSFLRRPFSATKKPFKK